MIILPDEASPDLMRGHAYRAIHETGFPPDLQVCPQGYFDPQLHLKDPFSR